MNHDNPTPEQRAKLEDIKRRILALEKMAKEYQKDLKRDMNRRDWWQRGDEQPPYDPQFS